MSTPYPPRTPLPPRPAARVLPGVNPRDVVTPDAFHVAPQLLGLPLARPWRRGSAMLVDLILIAILASAPSVLFGLVGALVLFRVSARPTPGGSYLRRSVRFGMRFGAAVLVFVALVSGWDSASEKVDRIEASLLGAPGAARQEREEEPSAVQKGVAGLRMAADFVAVERADDPAEARRRLQRAVQRLREQGVAESDIREMLRELATDPDERPWMAEVVDSVLAASALAARGGASSSPDSLATAYAEAVAAGDSQAVGSLRPRLAAALAADTLAAMDSRLRDLRRESGELRSEVETLREEASGRLGFVKRLRGLADELGLGLGWGGLYFTATVAMWKGRTPGKRLLGIRVLRLNGKPIGWWAAFERFGGYAAGLATGLFGFFQIYWDRNRQATHDKICETVVVRG